MKVSFFILPLFSIGEFENETTWDTEVNLWDSNIVDISGALFILKIQYQNQFEESARDINYI